MKNPKIFKNEKIYILSQIIFGAIFIYASLGKIINPNAFIDSILNFKILPLLFIKPAAIILPYVELVFGVFIILRLWVKISATILSGLLIVFIISIFSTIIRGINIDCGCFGKLSQISESQKSNPWILMIRDAIFLVPGLIIIFYKKD